MSIQFQMVGTGDAFAKAYFNNNALIQVDTFKFMIDFGQTAPLALHQLQYTLDQIDGVLITHLHADHTGGLEELAFQSMYRYGHKNGKIQLYIADTLVDALWENTLKAGLTFEKGGINTLSHYFDVHLFQEGKRYTITDGLTIELIKTPHIPDKLSYSLFINDNIFFTADMIFNRPLVEYAIYERKCSIVMHDCQLIGSGLVHSTLDELLTLPEDIQSKIYLMHYDDNMPKFIGKTGLMRFLEQQKLYVF